MFKKALKWGVIGLAVYGGANLLVKGMGKLKAKKEGGDPKSIKWVG